MDTLGLLGQALECSVCLEQLDSTSRVLPCQHTFCRKCLIDIINTRKELRCPECRVLVTVPFNSLPPNILLMRILEGIKKIPPTSSSSELLELSLNDKDTQSSSDPFSPFSDSPSISLSNGSSVVGGNTTQVSSSALLNPFLNHPNEFTPIQNLSPTSQIPILQNQNAPSQTNLSDFISHLNSLSINSITQSTSTASNSVSSPIQPISVQSASITQSLASSSIQPVSSSNLFLSGTENSLNFLPQSVNRNEPIETNVLPFSTTPASSSSTQAQQILSRETTANLSRPGSSLSQPTYTQAGTFFATQTSVSVLSNVSNSTVGTGSSRTSPCGIPQSESAFNIVESQTESHPFISSSSRHDESPLGNVRPSVSRQTSVKMPKESQSSGISAPYTSLRLQAKALYNYEGKDARDLKFKKGNIIVICKQIDDNWYQGEMDGARGIVPASYIKILEPGATHIPQCKALYDFKMISEEERNCLMFSKGETITVLRRIDDNWAEGKLNTHIGIFPLSFVELNDAAKTLIRLAGRISSGSTSSSASLKSSDVSHPNFKRSGSKPTSGQPDASSMPKPSSGTTLESLMLYVALYSYRPRKADELELRKNYFYTVTEKCQDGWFKGRCLTSGKVGVFPGNYVQLTDTQAISSISRSSSGLATIAGVTSSGSGTKSSHASTTAAYTRPKSASFTTQPPTGSLAYSLLDTPVQSIAPTLSPSPLPSLSPSLFRKLSQTLSSLPNNNAGDPRNVSNGSLCPPELPPRALTPSGKLAVSPLFQNSGQERSLAPSPSPSSSPSPVPQSGEKKPTAKERSFVGPNGGISLMRKLTPGKRRGKTTPIISMDNPVFEDSATNRNRSKSSVCNEDAEKNFDSNAKVSKQPAPLVRERYRCVAPYPANSGYELELQVGDIVYVHKRRDDGWLKGTLQRTGKTGLFPSIFVESC